MAMQNDNSAMEGSVSADLAMSSKLIDIKRVKVTLADKSVVTFCEYCHKCFKENKKCDYCFQVYFSAADDAQMDGKEWIGCDGCETWNHTDCEIA